MSRRTAPQDRYDCLTCGVCCVNPPSNVDESFKDWVQIRPKDEILKRKDLVKKHVTTNEAGDPHLRLDAEGRCLALQGKLGRNVTCRIYQQRPLCCRRVQPGDNECLALRAEHNIVQRW
jgi:Fe-S-cluster containining protein